MKRIILATLTLFLTVFSYSEIKYVFYMIGDGMGTNQILAAEMYRAELEGRIGRLPLTMTSFPYFGNATTYSASNGITDSSAAGTALSTGYKANNGCLGLDKDSMRVVSIAEQLHAQGWPIGLMTTVAIDHATPAAFYAHVNKRNKYYEIGKQLSTTGYDFFGGAGFHKPINKKDSMAPNIYDLCEQNGYTFAHGYADAQNKLDAKKLILIQENDGLDKIHSADCLPYAIEREENDLTLPQIVETAIDYLSPKGKFFMMIEGGKIDYAGHSRDGATNIKEVLDFDEAIHIAYKFYLEHPDETLIVITADHETGGMSLGNSNYKLNLQILQHQKLSSWTTNLLLSELYKKHGKKLHWEQVKSLLIEALGLYEFIEVTKDENAQLQAAYKRMICGKQKCEKTLYNNISELGGMAVEILNKKAKIGWTSYSHTAANVPVFAIGHGAEIFTGWYDNTEIPKRISAILSNQK